MRPADRQWATEQVAILRAARRLAARGGPSDHYAMLIGATRVTLRVTMAKAALMACIDHRAAVATRAALRGVSQPAIEQWRLRRAAADHAAHPFPTTHH